jgi:hypothetical protein
MSEQQLDFFSDIGIGVGHPLSQNIADHALLSAGTMDDETLIAAIPESTLAQHGFTPHEVGLTEEYWWAECAARISEALLFS